MIGRLTEAASEGEHGLERGFVQIYTGDGKGKTTAALGLALRARGFGLKVAFLQFAKRLRCSEHEAAELLGFSIEQGDAPTPAERAAEILEHAHRALVTLDGSSPVDVLILDEIGEALRRGYVRRADIESLIAEKPATTELVLTGRGLLPFADLADLVTEMRCVKHYFDEGVLARKGIEY